MSTFTPFLLITLLLTCVALGAAAAWIWRRMQPDLHLDLREVCKMRALETDATLNTWRRGFVLDFPQAEPDDDKDAFVDQIAISPEVYTTAAFSLATHQLNRKSRRAKEKVRPRVGSGLVDVWRIELASQQLSPYFEMRLRRKVDPQQDIAHEDIGGAPLEVLLENDGAVASPNPAFAWEVLGDPQVRIALETLMTAHAVRTFEVKNGELRVKVERAGLDGEDGWNAVVAADRVLTALIRATSQPEQIVESLRLQA